MMALTYLTQSSLLSFLYRWLGDTGAAWCIGGTFFPFFFERRLRPARRRQAGGRGFGVTTRREEGA